LSLRANDTVNGAADAADAWEGAMEATIAWHGQGDVEDALERARREDRAVLVDFWSPGCKGCQAYERETYPDADVAAFLNERFVAIKYNTHQPSADLKRLTGTTALLWTPTLVVLTPQLREVRRMVGFLSPDELLAELGIALGLADLARQRYPEAAARFAPVAHTDLPTAAEALYWLGVAEFYRGGKSIAPLAPHWRAIGERFPESTWWTRADVLDEAAVPAAA
jgi:thiol-disulfide isomerase/thioredoxin